MAKVLYIMVDMSASYARHFLSVYFHCENFKMKQRFASMTLFTCHSCISVGPTIT